MPDEQREPTQARVERVAEWLWRHSGGRTPLDEATDVIGQPISDAYREQAREIIALLEPASPTPQEQEQIDPELYRQCEDAGHPPVTPGSSCHCGLRPQEQVGGPALSHSGEKGRGDALAQAVEDYIATWQPPHASQMEEALLAYLRTPTEGAE